MLGKGAILVVFGFILAFSSFQVRMSGNVMATSNNFNDQYMSTLIHETSLSAINLAINKVWADSTTNASYLLVANACSSQTNISAIPMDTVKVKVKTWGYLYNDDFSSTVKQSDSIAAYFAYNTPISRFFWFTNDENGVYWLTGDSVWGPVHTNGVLKTSGAPVFFSKVSAHLGINPDPISSSAEFVGGWEVGISNDIPTDMSYIINAANLGNGGAPTNTKSLYDLPMELDFQADGSVFRTVQGFPTDTVQVVDIAPEGAIYSSADIRVKGNFNGQVTFLTTTNIWIDDDLVYADNPLSNPASDDILGLVALNNVYVTDNAANNTDIHIQACIMATNGSFTAENWSSRPISGYLNMTGSIVQKERGAVGKFSSGSIISGFSKRYRFDSRLHDLSPPNYPFIKSLRLVSWWE